MPHTTSVLSIEAGSSKTFPLTLVQDDGVTVINLTGATAITALCKRSLYDADSAAVITASVANSKITVVSATAGTVTISLPPTDTTGILTTTSLQFAVKVTFSSTNEVFGALGVLTITPMAVQAT